jgi:hypothetical protein
MPAMGVRSVNAINWCRAQTGAYRLSRLKNLAIMAFDR